MTTLLLIHFIVAYIYLILIIFGTFLEDPLDPDEYKDALIIMGVGILPIINILVTVVMTVYFCQSLYINIKKKIKIYLKTLIKEVAQDESGE